MYTFFKKSVKKILPENVLIRNEFIIRKILSVFYTGKKVRCNVCEKSFSRFIHLENLDNLCPRCGSLARHRRLWQFIDREASFQPDHRILDFSPSRMLMKYFWKLYPNYVTTDFQKNILTDKNYDITSISEPDNTFDRIICYHVLEHIENDLKAMSELFRVLKPKGSAIIQTPFTEGATYENPAITSETDRLQHFGKEDHVRIYSVKGLQERLDSVGFSVNVFGYHEEPGNFYGFKETEYILLAQKNQ
ncbi:MAG: class I SAM-dependent methyltransferase [Bacteroidales bacterium]|nr:class I SAM-dependent methyltransferase [Bacteroidales bacterium]